MKNRHLLGIDIGGSGVKGAVVDLKQGKLVTERIRIPTPQPSTPGNVAAVTKEIVDALSEHVDESLPVGVTIPAIVLHGVTVSAANIDESWLGADAADIFSEALGRPVVLVNDADAAGLAEVRWGAASGHPGMVIVTTLGTGIGSALVYRGVLVPNTELGHLEIDGYDAETRAAASIKKKENLSYEEYIPRLQRYYETVEFLFSPDLFVVGGGISKDSEKFLPFLKLRAPIIPAKLRNAAGIVGAAAYAADSLKNPDKLAK